MSLELVNKSDGPVMLRKSGTVEELSIIFGENSSSVTTRSMGKNPTEGVVEGAAAEEQARSSGWGAGCAKEPIQRRGRGRQQENLVWGEDIW